MCVFFSLEKNSNSSATFFFGDELVTSIRIQKICFNFIGLKIMLVLDVAGAILTSYMCIRCFIFVLTFRIVLRIHFLPHRFRIYVLCHSWRVYFMHTTYAYCSLYHFTCITFLSLLVFFSFLFFLQRGKSWLDSDGSYFLHVYNVVLRVSIARANHNSNI